VGGEHPNSGRALRLEAGEPCIPGLSLVFGPGEPLNVDSRIFEKPLNGLNVLNGVWAGLLLSECC